MKSLEDEKLVELYKSGNASAFEELYSRYIGKVKYVARKLFLLGADYEDLWQEGLFGLIKAVNSYKPYGSSFSTYATLCIKTSLYTAVKKYSGNSSLPLNQSASYEVLDKIGLSGKMPEDESIEKEGVKELKKLIESNLTENELSVLKLYLLGLSYEEISKKTGKNIKSIDNALQRARKKIEKCLKG